MEHKTTGILFNEHQSVPAIVEAVREFEASRFDREFISRRAKRFSKEAFKKGITAIVRNAGYKI